MLTTLPEHSYFSRSHVHSILIFKYLSKFILHTLLMSQKFLVNDVDKTLIP